ncbi:MAG: hypothetical protein OEQ49_18990 [Myxococcales bacterium]|nr:hypothetical protein [Myxococcales bacterium]
MHRRKDGNMGKAWQLLLMAGILATGLWLAPNHADAAKCHFSKKEKIAMVSWVMLVPGAVITGLSCKRDLFKRGGNRDAALPAENRGRTDLRIIDLRRRGRI